MMSPVGTGGGATAASTMHLRREPFEFGLLPASYLLPRVETAAALVPIQKRLLAAASTSPSSPGRSVVTAEAAANSMGISLTSAGHVLDTLAAVSPREDAAGGGGGGASHGDGGGVGGAGAVADEIHVQSLLLYLFLQTYTRPHAQSQLREAAGTEAWPEPGGAGVSDHHGHHHPGGAGGSPSKGAGAGAGAGGGGDGVQRSPGKRTRDKHAEAEALHLAFVMHHWSAISGLLVNSENKVGSAGGGRGGGGGGGGGGIEAGPYGQTGRGGAGVGVGGAGAGAGVGGAGGGGGGDVELTAQEVDHLEFIFAPFAAGAGSTAGAEDALGVRRAAARPSSFSALTGLFKSPGQTVPASAVRDWVVKHCAGIGQHGQSHQHTSAAAAAAAANGGLVLIENVHKGTAVRREADVPAGWSARISGCHDAVVYLLAPVEYASITGCSDCVVVVGAVTRALRVEQCERLTCIAATKRLQVRSCHEGTFFLGIARQPMFIGDNRRNRVAPYNTFYEQLERHLAAAGLSAQCAAWDQPVVIGSPGGSASSFHAAVEVLPPEKFSPFIVPFRGAPPPPGCDAAVTQANPFKARPLPLPLAVSPSLALFHFPFTPSSSSSSSSSSLFPFSFLYDQFTSHFILAAGVSQHSAGVKCARVTPFNDADSIHP